MTIVSRQQQWNAFIDQGLPTKREENWKYTDLAFLANKKFYFSECVELEKIKPEISKYRLPQNAGILLVIVNGQFIADLSDVDKLPKNVIISTVNEAMLKQADLIKKYQLTDSDTKNYAFANINRAIKNDGLFLHVPDNCNIVQPVHLLSLTVNSEEFISQPHHIVILGKKSKLTLIEEHRTLFNKCYMTNIVMNVIAENDAKLEHIKIQAEAEQAVHIASTFVKQKQNSNVVFTNFSSGSLFARDDLVVKLLESGASCRAAGFYRLNNDGQYIDHHVDIAHFAPRSHSEMLYKGVVNKKSRAVFNGRLYVDQAAQKILAHQANHNLLLSNDAEVYSKPELEIYADDVKCKHGATTGQLDQDALFYMRVRGIEKADAVKILLQGFAEEIVQRTSHLEVRQRIQEHLL